MEGERPKVGSSRRCVATPRAAGETRCESGRLLRPNDRGGQCAPRPAKILVHALVVVLVVCVAVATPEIRATSADGADAGSAFLHLSDALAAAGAGGEVLAGPGLYSGAGNSTLVMSGQTLRCKEAGACVVHCGSGLGTGFLSLSGSAPVSRVFGFVVQGCHGVTFGGSSSYGGGAVAIGGALELHDVVIAECLAITGGALFVQGAAVLLNRVTMRSCASSSGGCLVSIAGGDVTIHNSTLQRCTANSHGGAIATDSRIDMVDSIIDKAETYGGYGGAVYAYGHAEVRASNVTLSHSSGSLRGSAIHLSGAASATLRNVDTRDCKGSAQAAVFMAGSSVAHVVGGSVRQCGTAAWHGGAFYLMESSALRLTNFTAAANVAAGGGVVAAVDAAKVHAESSTFSGNTAAIGSAGVFFLQDAVSLHVRDSSMIHNVAQQSGGVVSASGAFVTASFTNSTMLRNTAVQGAVLATGGAADVNMSYCTASHNVAVAAGGVLSLFGDSTSRVDHSTFSHNSVPGGIGGAFQVGEQAFADLAGVVVHSSYAENGAFAVVGNVARMHMVDTHVHNTMAVDSAGALYVADFAVMHILQSSFVNISAGRLGGQAVVVDSASLVLEDVTVVNATAATAGAIHSEGSSVTDMRNVSLASCTSSGSGGALQGAQDAHISATNVSCTRCAATFGGCLHAGDSTTVVANAIHVSLNTAKFGGGGIHIVNSAKLTVSNSSFERNTCFHHGGSVGVSDSAHLQMLQSTCSGSSAWSWGGCVYASTGGTVLFSASTFIDNRAYVGAACYVSAKSTYIRCTFAQNMASFNGGALFADRANCTLHNSTFLHNRAALSGGAWTVAQKSVVNASNCTFIDNHASSHGGAIYNHDSQVHLHDSQILRSSADLGGGIASEGGGSVLATQCVFEQNFARFHAGALWLTDGSHEIADCDMKHNSAGASAGTIGGLFASLVLRRSRFVGSVSGGMGGDVFVQACAVLVQRCVFTKPVAASNGGSISVQPSQVDASRQSSIVVEDSHIDRGTSSSGGGGISVVSSTATLRRLTIHRASAGVSGGAIVAWESSMLVVDVAIANCSAISHGGSIAAQFNSNVQLSGVTISQSVSYSAGGIHVTTSSHVSAIGLVCMGCWAIERGGSVALDLEGSMFAVNMWARASNAAFGAVFALQQSTAVTVVNFTAQDSVARESGGVLRSSRDAIVSISNALMERIRCAESGGALQVSGGSVWLTDSQIAQSHSSDGGAVFVDTASQFIMERVAFTNASAANTAGAVSSALNSEMQVDWGLFEHCSAAFGGAFSAGRGASLLLQRSVMRNSTGHKGGGALYATAAATISLVDAVVDRCSSFGAGGAIRAVSTGTSIVVNGSALEHCSADFGGAVYVGVDAKLTMTRSHVHHNSAVQSGGAICVGRNKGVLVGDSVFENNLAAVAGGAFAFDSFVRGEVSGLVRVLFIRNQGTHGGALVISSVAEVVVVDCEFVSNSAFHSGGAVSAQPFGRLAVADSAFVSNEAVHRGGGLHSGTHTVVYDSKFALNVAENGGGVYLFAGSLGLSNSTMQHNEALRGRGGGLCVIASASVNLRIENVTMEANNASHGGALAISGQAAVEALAAIDIQITTSTFHANSVTCKGTVLSCGGAANIHLDSTTSASLSSVHAGAVPVECVSASCRIFGADEAANACMQDLQIPVHAIPGSAVNETDSCCGTAVRPCLGIVEALANRGRDGVIQLHPGEYRDAFDVSHVNFVTISTLPSAASVAIFLGSVSLVSGTLQWSNMYASGNFRVESQAAHVILTNMTIARSSPASVVAATGGDVTLSGSQIVQAHSLSTPEACVQLASNARLWLDSVVFQSCTSSTHGGAIRAESLSHVQGRNVQFEECRAAAGGAVSLSGASATMNVVHCRRCGAATFGGCFGAETGSVVLLGNSTVEHSYGSNGGAIALRQSHCQLCNVTIENCTASEHGGAVAAVGSTLRAEGSTISGCASALGGAISHAAISPTWVHLSSPLARSSTSLFNSTLRNNMATAGGAIAGDGDLTIDNSDLRNNAAVDDGGAVQCRSRMSSAGTAFVGNMARHGGAISLDGACRFVSQRDSFKANSAGATGGAVHATFSAHNVQLAVNGTEYSSNRAYSAGGALLLSGSSWASSVTFGAGVLFKENQCVDGAGGGVFVAATVQDVRFCPIANARAEGNCAAFGADAFLPQSEVCRSTLASAGWFAAGLPERTAVIEVAVDDSMRALHDAVLVADPVSGATHVRSGNSSVSSLAVAVLDASSVPTPLDASSSAFATVVGIGQISVSGTTRAYFRPSQRINVCARANACCDDWYAQPPFSASFLALRLFGPPGSSGFVTVTVAPSSMAVSDLRLPVVIQACPAGLQPDDTGNVCKACSSGRYKSQSVPDECFPCEAGATSVAGSSMCMPCPPGTRAVRGLTCEECPEYTVLQDGECVTCHDDGVTCVGGVALMHEGYWLPEGETFSVGVPLYICSPGHCIVGINGSTVCAQHRGGPICALCVGNRYEQGAHCANCPQAGLAVATVVLAGTAVCAAVAYAIRRASTAWDRVHLQAGVATPLFKTTASYLQLSGLLNSFDVPWPKLVSAWWNVGSSTSTVAAGGVLSCVIPSGVYSQFWFVVLAVATAMALAYAVPVIASRCSTTPVTSRVGVLVVLYTAYPSLALRAFSVLRCSPEIEGVSYVLDDFAEQCGTRAHSLHVSASLLLLLGVLVPFPIACGTVLFRAFKAKKLHDRGTTGSLLFLWDGYHSKRAYYESIVMLRKLCVCAISAVLRKSDRFYQASMGYMALVFFLLLQIVLKPYHDKRQALLDNLSLGATAVSLYVGQLLTHGLSGAPETVALLMLVGANFVFVVACIGILMREARSRAALRAGTDKPSGSQPSARRGRLRSWTAAVGDRAPTEMARRVSVLGKPPPRGRRSTLAGRRASTARVVRRSPSQDVSALHPVVEMPVMQNPIWDAGRRRTTHSGTPRQS